MCLAGTCATLCLLISTLAYNTGIGQSSHAQPISLPLDADLSIYGRQQQGRPSCCSTRVCVVLYNTCDLINSNFADDHSQAFKDSQLTLYCMRYLPSHEPYINPICVRYQAWYLHSSTRLYCIVSGSRKASCQDTAYLQMSLYKRQQASSKLPQKWLTRAL